EVGRLGAELALQAFDRRLDADVRARAVALGQAALVHRVVRDLDQRVRPALPGRPHIVGAKRPGQRLDGRLERGASRRIEPGVEPVHPARGLAEVERAQLEALFAVALEAFAVPLHAGFMSQVAQLFDREAPGNSDPVFLLDVLTLLAHLVAEVADDRGRLETDLACAQRLGDAGQLR